MATFNIHQDQENSTINPSKLKENGIQQKRTVLRVINKNSDQPGESKIPIYKNVGLKETTTAKGKEENEKQYLNCKVISQKQKPKLSTQTFQNVGREFKIFEESACEIEAPDANKKKIAVKEENKSRVLRDKTVDYEQPSSSRGIEISTCITELHREPKLSSIYTTVSSEENVIDDAENIVQDSPMSIDTSKTESSLKVDLVSRKDEQTANERLFACDEYKTEIFVYLRSEQHKHRPRKNYMLKQPDISYSMRAILIDWLVEVVEEYRMKTETLYLAVSYIDRFLSYMSVVRAKLQLVGTAAMFIASKFEEIYPPDVKDFVFVTDDTYSKRQVLRMEHLILKVLSFDLSTPTILCFLTYFLSNYPTTDRVKYLAMYLCELTLLEADPFLGFLPSDTAASALIVARYTLSDEIGEEAFPEKFQEAIDHHLEDLIVCIAAFDKVFQKSSSNPQKAIKEKYKSDKYLNVSSIEPLNEDCSAYLMKKYLGQDGKESVAQS